MNRPRLKLGLDASRSTLNEADCAQIGRELALMRERQGLTTEKVGAVLLLAPRQVTALETVELGAFYGAEFYVAALKKYVVLMGLDVADVDRALVRATRPHAPLPFERSRRTVSASLAGPLKPSKRIALAALVLVSVAAGSVLLTALRRTSAGSSPSDVPGQGQPRDSLVPTVSSEQALSATNAVVTSAGTAALSDTVRSPAVDGVSDGRERVQDATLAVPTPSIPIPPVGRVRVGQATWVFVRYADGTTVERVLGRGEGLTLQARPTYLAVGSADDTVVEIDGHTIDNSQFIVNGALRVGSSQLAQLVAPR